MSQSLGRNRARRRLSRAAVRALRALVALALLFASVTAVSTILAPTASAADNPIAAKPYMGWSSWSLQATSYPGVNAQGNYSWLTEANVLTQAHAMATELKSHGYDYVNIDAGWWMDWNWTPGYDSYARQTPNPQRFPDGIAYVAKQVHAMGLKLGIYLPVGLEKAAYNNGNSPIYGAPGCTTKDIVYSDLRTTNGWDSSYKLNFANPCAQSYVDSMANELAGWGVDFLKFDGVGPGSDKSGPNYDNSADVAAWSKALKATHRPIQFMLSWSLDHDNIATWEKYSNGARIDTDVECYCDTLVTWDNSVKERWDDVVPWISDAHPGYWNNLDSLDVGDGAMDGISDVERQSYMTLWAIESAPLYTGDDLTKLDSYGLSLLTNDQVIAIDQQGRPAKPVVAHAPTQVWYTRDDDGSYTVALFNMTDSPATVTANFSDVGFTGRAAIQNVWTHQNLGSFNNSYSAQLPAHGSQLLRVDKLWWS
ncbi:MAG TPA: glycoside hydrolase family 27 protein [Pseudonocardiaceae bacterium]|jgi:hypothetical protein|nr:glycoside hydrolase family 27 protein [Pseudonocardiaceae bacterium]